MVKFKTKNHALAVLLVSLGWRPAAGHGPYEVEIWWKRFAGYPVCQCNKDKPGIQAVLTISTPIQDSDSEAYKIEVRGEKKDGIWVNFEAYGFSNLTILKELEPQTLNLLALWALVNKQPSAP